MPQRENRLSALDSTVFVCMVGMMSDDECHKEWIECKQNGRCSISYHDLSCSSD